jgi:hypothetical protein
MVKPVQNNVKTASGTLLDTVYLIRLIFAITGTPALGCAYAGERI